MKKLKRQCPVCLSKYGTVLKKIDMVLPDNLSIPGTYDVVYCCDCGFTFADVDASQSMYDQYYQINNHYSHSAVLKSEITDSMNHARYQLLGRYADKNAKILDIGCGNGSLLKLLKMNGFHNLYGMDPSKESIEKLKEQGIRGTVKNVFDEIADEHKYAFDIVMSTAVMEHIYDIQLFLRQLLCYLVPQKGLLYVDVPAVEGFEKIYMRRANYFNHEHINYFSLASLDNVFSKNGCTRKSSDKESIVVIGGDQEQPEMAITAVYGNLCVTTGLKKDMVSRRSIQNYFRQDELNEGAALHKIQEFIRKNGTQVVIWGTGAYTMQLLQNMPELQKMAVCFIDNNVMKVGRKMLGKEIFAPEKLLKDDLPYPVLVCSMQNSGDIVRQIKEMDISNQYLAI